MTNNRARAVFAGCVKNCAQHLPAVLRNIERIATLFSESAFVFVENDSTDGTKQILSNWGSGRTNFTRLPLDGLDQAEPIRTRRIEFARNAYYQMIRSGNLASFDYLIVLDFDEVNAQEIDLAVFRRALSFLDATPDTAAVFANQPEAYYDLWALRHHKLCPADIWVEVFEYARAHAVSHETACGEIFTRRAFSLPASDAPLEVDSAFGGLG